MNNCRHSVGLPANHRRRWVINYTVRSSSPTGATPASQGRRARWRHRPSPCSSRRASPAPASLPTTIFTPSGGLRSASAAGSWPAARPWSSTRMGGASLLPPSLTAPSPGERGKSSNVRQRSWGTPPLPATTLCIVRPIVLAGRKVFLKLLVPYFDGDFIALSFFLLLCKQQSPEQTGGKLLYSLDGKYEMLISNLSVKAKC